MKTRNQARLISQQINIMAETMSTIINLSIESTEINDHLATCYPFEESLDDLLPNVKAWANAQAIHPEMDEDEHPVQITKGLAIAVIEAWLDKSNHHATQFTVDDQGFPSLYGDNSGDPLPPLDDAIVALVEYVFNWRDLLFDGNRIKDIANMATYKRTWDERYEGDHCRKVHPLRYTHLIVELMQKQYQYDGEYGFSYDEYLSWFWDRARNGDNLLDFMGDTFESFGFKLEDEAEIWHLICEQKEDMKHMR